MTSERDQALLVAAQALAKIIDQASPAAPPVQADAAAPALRVPEQPKTEAPEPPVDPQAVQPLRDWRDPSEPSPGGRGAERARQFLVVSLGYLGVALLALTVWQLVPLVGVGWMEFLKVTLLASLPIDIAWIVNMARRRF